MVGGLVLPRRFVKPLQFNSNQLFTGFWLGGYELLDQLSEPFFRLAGGYVANFSSSVDSNSEEIYSRQVLYSSYTSIHVGIHELFQPVIGKAKW